MKKIDRNPTLSFRFEGVETNKDHVETTFHVSTCCGRKEFIDRGEGRNSSDCMHGRSQLGNYRRTIGNKNALSAANDLLPFPAQPRFSFVS